MTIYFYQLSVGLTFHVYRGLPAHTPGRRRSGQSMDAVAGSTLHCSRWSNPSAHGTGVAWRGIGTGSHEAVAKTTDFGHTVPAVVKAIGIEAYVAKIFLQLSHTTRPVWVVLEALGWRSSVELYLSCGAAVSAHGSAIPRRLGPSSNSSAAAGGNRL